MGGKRFKKVYLSPEDEVADAAATELKADYYRDIASGKPPIDSKLDLIKGVESAPAPKKVEDILVRERLIDPIHRS